MKISKRELDHIIKEEIKGTIDEGWLDTLKSGASRLGKRKPAKLTKEYPATELTALLATLQKASRDSGVQIKGRRGVLVDEFEKLLASQGFALNEADERVFIGQEGNIEISADVAPTLVQFLQELEAESPEVFANVSRELGNYRFGVRGAEEEDIDVAALAGSDEELRASADAISAAAGDPDDEGVEIALDPEAADTEIDLTDEPSAEETSAPAESWEELEFADSAAAINLLRRISGQAGAPVLRIGDIEAARDLALEKLETSKSQWAPRQRVALELTTQRLIDLLRSGLGKREPSPVAEWTRLELQAAGVLLESVTRILNESQETQRWRALSGIQ